MSAVAGIDASVRGVGSHGAEGIGCDPSVVGLGAIDV